MKRRSWWGTLRNLLAALGLLVCLVTFTPLDFYYARWLGGPWQLPRGGTVIVPGADMELVPDILGQHSYRRVFYVLHYWRLHGFSRIVLLGKDVGPAMREWLIQNGVPAEAILVESQSLNTAENAAAGKQILAAHPDLPRPFMLLSSDFHVARCLYLFRQLGVELEPVVVPDALKRCEDWRGRWPTFLNLAEESIKLAATRAGWR